ncbi:hypothetical protein [Salipiger sp.]|uniref:hypothetical protein n=1 Tax=Salipiger sp. TaxID=2078585 RepID=UPI003A96EAD5
MRKTLALIAAIACCAVPAAAASGDGTATYDLLFRNGTLDGIDRGETLVYQRVVSNTAKPEAAERDTGKIVLGFESGQMPMATLDFRQDDKHRSLGTFPASVGNPMIMYFYESVVRDIAETAGGSPFYIRNRVKESLVQPSEVLSGEAEVDGRTVPTQTIVLHPFADDPNRDRMMGFGDIALTVVMSEAVPGWYLSLGAEAPGADGGAGYRSEMTFDRIGEGQ